MKHHLPSIQWPRYGGLGRRPISSVDIRTPAATIRTRPVFPHFVAGSSILSGALRWNRRKICQTPSGKSCRAGRLSRTDACSGGVVGSIGWTTSQGVYNGAIHQARGELVRRPSDSVYKRTPSASRRMLLVLPISWSSDWDQANQIVFTRVLCKQFSQLSTSGNVFNEAVRIESTNELGMLFSLWDQVHPANLPRSDTAAGIL